MAACQPLSFASQSVSSLSPCLLIFLPVLASYPTAASPSARFPATADSNHLHSFLAHSPIRLPACSDVQTAWSEQHIPDDVEIC